MLTGVQKLSSVQRPELFRHLKTLSAEDRRLRFGTYMMDAALDQYVHGIDFAHDKVFGIFGRDMALIGMAHLALDRNHDYAELGLSVEPSHRFCCSRENVTRFFVVTCPVNRPDQMSRPCTDRGSTLLSAR